MQTPNSDWYQIVQHITNDHYINIVERSCGEKPTSVAKQRRLTDDIKVVDHIVRHYEDHSGVRHAKKDIKTPQKLYLFFVNNIWTRSQKDT